MNEPMMKPSTSPISPLLSRHPAGAADRRAAGARTPRRRVPCATERQGVPLHGRGSCHPAADGQRPAAELDRHAHGTEFPYDTPTAPRPLRPAGRHVPDSGDRVGRPARPRLTVSPAPAPAGFSCPSDEPARLLPVLVRRLRQACSGPGSARVRTMRWCPDASSSPGWPGALVAGSPAPSRALSPHFPGISVGGRAKGRAA